jgi:glycosyltransferase involved in cell wall biosynthesis
MRVGIYAGSLRPGGGVTALRQVLDALLAMPEPEVTVYTGAADCSEAVRDLVDVHPRLHEVRFHPEAGSFARYLRSKTAFRRLGRDLDWLFSVNYDLPAPCPVAVYHLNLLSFQRGPADGLGAAIKRWDARRACRRAALNLFESNYLLDRAREQVGGAIRRPELLYLGIHPDFFPEAEVPAVEVGEGGRADLLMVSSMAPHKDNLTAVRALQLLVEEEPAVDWRLRIAGGQAKAQWDPLLAEGAALGMDTRIEVLGPLPRRELSQVMGASLCLVNPSRIESFCMVALEAMASSCPAVVTTATSMPESVGGAAPTVEPGDHRAFAAELRRHLDPEHRARAVARGRAHAAGYGQEAFRRRLQGILTA